MLVLEDIEKPVSLLVGDRPHLMESAGAKLFCTISPNATTLHQIIKRVNGRKVTVKMPYGKIPQRLQYEYCIRIINRCYLPFLSEGSELIGSWELNKQGNVHLHFIVVDSKITNDTHLSMFQRDVLNCEDVIKNMGKGKKMIDYMNNIVFITKPFKEVIRYIDKDYDKNKGIFNNYYAVTTDSQEDTETIED